MFFTYATKALRSYLSSCRDDFRTMQAKNRAEGDTVDNLDFWYSNAEEQNDEITLITMGAGLVMAATMRIGKIWIMHKSNNYAMNLFFSKYTTLFLSSLHILVSSAVHGSMFFYSFNPHYYFYPERGTPNEDKLEKNKIFSVAIAAALGFIGGCVNGSALTNSRKQIVLGIASAIGSFVASDFVIKHVDDRLDQFIDHGGGDKFAENLDNALASEAANTCVDQVFEIAYGAFLS